jgi:hypothetical protein
MKTIEKKQWEEEFVKKYPLLYKEYGLKPDKSCMAWGFDIPIGWRWIIEELSEKLDTLSKHSGLHIVVKQVKEKFGGLRYYYAFEDTSIDNIICQGFDRRYTPEVVWLQIINYVVSYYEDISRVTCMTCGKNNRNNKLCCNK